MVTTLVNTLNVQQELFATLVFSGMTQRAAYIQVYKPLDSLSMAAVDSRASDIASNPKVRARIHELQAEAASRIIDTTVATVQERKQVLTEIIRARLGDFIDQDGNVDLTNAEARRSPALGSIKKTSWSGGRDQQASSETVHLTIRSPLDAIKELNLMERLYSEAGAFIKDEHKEVNIYVIDGKAKDLLAKVRARTGKLLTGGDSQDDLS